MSVPGPGGLRRRIGLPLVAGLIAGFSAFGLRLVTAESVFRDGAVNVPLFDEAYHARRIAHAVQHFPSLPDPDPRRGVAGAFTPWPPLYDLGAATLVRVVAGEDPGRVLEVAVWIPPLLGAAAAALVAASVAATGGFLAGLSAGLLLAVSPAHAAATALGSIDHHGAEALLVILLLGATLRVACGSSARGGGARAALLGGALLAALFLQTSFLLFAGATFATLFLVGSRRTHVAVEGAVALAVAAAGVAAWGATRPRGYPVSGWYLGLPHAWILAGAAAALALLAVLRARGLQGAGAPLAALAAGCALALASGSVLPALGDGVAFLGSDPWLDGIEEFQPLVTGVRSVPGAVVFLGGGCLVALPFLAFARRLGTADLVVATWSAATLAATLGRVRYAILAAPLLALGAGRAVALLAGGGWRRLAAAVVVLCLLPFAGARGRLVDGEVHPVHVRPVLRAASFLAGRCGPAERVLAPWSWGHALNAFGGCSVLVDGFGSMPGRASFEAALAATLATREDRLLRFCRERHVRWIVLANPLFQVPVMAEDAGYAPEAYLAQERGGPPRVTRLAQATVWWRAYFDGRPGVPGAARPRTLRRAWADPQPAWEPAPYGGPAMLILEVPPVSSTP